MPMDARKRVRKIFDFGIPDRIAFFDDISDNAVKRWQGDGSMPAGAAAQEFFDFDLRLFGFDQTFSANSKNVVTAERLNMPSAGEDLKENYEKAKKAGKFLVLSCMEPFEHISRVVGRERLLTMMAEEATKTANLFADSAEFTLSACRLVADKGYKFDGAWLWGDLGYGAGLMFSLDYYNAYLFDLHKGFCDFFNKLDMPVIYHSDGNIRDIIPHLIEAGVRAVHPLESDVGMDLVDVKREYGKDIVLIGGVDEKSFADRKKTEGEIKKKFKYLMKNGGYIYHADSPILEDVSFENYKKVLESVKQYGVY